MVRRCFWVLVVVILIVSCMAVQTVFAEGLDRIQIEQVYARLPEIDVYFNVFDMQGEQAADLSADTGQIQATLDGEPLDVSDMVPYRETDKGTCYFYLLDVSKSVPMNVFEQAQEALTRAVESLGDSDKMILITFGEEIVVQLTGEEDNETAKQKIDAIERNANQTRFFDAVNNVLDINKTEFDDLPERKVIVAITDGEDIYTGGNTKDETFGRLQDSGIPFFALGLEETDDEHIDALGEFARSTGGDINLINAENTSVVMEDLRERLNGVYVLSLKSATNVVDGTTRTLSLQIHQGEYTLKAAAEVVCDMHIVDDTAPSVVSAETRGAKELVVIYGEDVTGADNAAHYSVTAEDGTAISVSDVHYDAESYKAILTISETIYNGDYTLALSGITDVSMEKNPLVDAEFGFVVTGNQRPEPPIEEESFLSKYWWIIVMAGAVILAALIIAIALAAKKKRMIAEEAESSGPGVLEKHHVKNKDGRTLRLKIVDQNGLERVLDVFVQKTVTIGRSDSCDVYFDDVEMSRRHARISLIDNNFYIEDLGSMNGTILNGVKIGQQRILNDRDQIEIGQIKIIVSL